MKSIVRIGLFTVFAALATAPYGWAVDGQIPDALPQIVERGLSAFNVNGGKSAVENWTRGGPLEGTLGEESEIESIQKLEKLYGRFQGYSIIEQVDLGKGSRLIYLEVQLEDGPIYIKYHVYDGRKGERIVGLKVEAAPDQILPDYVMEKRSRQAASPR